MSISDASIRQHRSLIQSTCKLHNNNRCFGVLIVTSDPSTPIPNYPPSPNKWASTPILLINNSCYSSYTCIYLSGSRSVATSSPTAHQNGVGLGLPRLDSACFHQAVPLVAVNRPYLKLFARINSQSHNHLIFKPYH